MARRDSAEPGREPGHVVKGPAVGVVGEEVAQCAQISGGDSRRADAERHVRRILLEHALELVAGDAVRAEAQADRDDRLGRAHRRRRAQERERKAARVAVAPLQRPAAHLAQELRGKPALERGDGAKADGAPERGRVPPPPPHPQDSLMRFSSARLASSCTCSVRSMLSASCAQTAAPASAAAPSTARFMPLSGGGAAENAAPAPLLRALLKSNGHV